MQLMSPSAAQVGAPRRSFNHFRFFPPNSLKSSASKGLVCVCFCLFVLFLFELLSYDFVLARAFYFLEGHPERDPNSPSE